MTPPHLWRALPAERAQRELTHERRLTDRVDNPRCRLGQTFEHSRASLEVGRWIIQRRRECVERLVDRLPLRNGVAPPSGPQLVRRLPPGVDAANGPGDKADGLALPEGGRDLASLLREPGQAPRQRVAPVHRVDKSRVRQAQPCQRLLGIG